ncbi:GNAT family N-acetyltransferase [Mammaliicoccus sciuri]
MGDDYLEVQRLYMYKQYQSKGIGSQLMKKAFEIAKEQQKSKLWLGVWEA